MASFFLFVFGLIFGSFLNVVALRYDGEHFLFDPAVIGGRSHCPHCKGILRWFELVPVVSFLFQGAKCRRCGYRIGMRYLLLELLTGALFVVVPWRLASLIPPAGPLFWLLSSLWIVVFMFLILISYIDIRLGIIPDESHILLGSVAVIFIVLASFRGDIVDQSFLGNYALLLGFQGSLLANRIIGMLFGFIFFGALVLLTRGKGMGMGDVKLALPLGLLLGWPDMLVATLAAFVVGAAVGIGGIMLKRKTMNGTLPFGPFLAGGVAFVFLFGAAAAQWYFRLLGL